MYDLHLHSTYSDGDQSVADLVAAAAAAGVTGISVTDHNGLWGVAEAEAEAKHLGLEYVQGIEVSAYIPAADVHILGYSRAFASKIVTSGLAATREGYLRRTYRMIELCGQAGYRLTPTQVMAVRAGQREPVYMAYDIARALIKHYGLSIAAARQLTTHGGLCHVPYGSWALTPAAVIELIHRAGGIAILAHPGTIAHESGEAVLATVLADVVAAAIDGIEVYHPFHTAAVTAQLQHYIDRHHLVASGGSDYHGPHRYHEGALGTVGLTTEGMRLFYSRLAMV